MANREGKQQAITTISPMKALNTCKLSFFFFIRSLGLAMGEAKKLKRLSFIHFARWAIIKRDAFPHLGGSQPRETLKYDYLLFCSNFNGSWDQYIDAFSDILPSGMNNIWKWSQEYPGSIPTTPFKEYIRHNQIGTDYYYSAYPGATTNDVKSALHLRQEYSEFVQEHGDKPPDLFEEEFQRFLVRVQADLGSTGST
jgi:hypothetical protein